MGCRGERFSRSGNCGSVSICLSPFVDLACVGIVLHAPDCLELVVFGGNLVDLQLCRSLFDGRESGLENPSRTSHSVCLLSLWLWLWLPSGDRRLYSLPAPTEWRIYRAHSHASRPFTQERSCRLVVSNFLA